MMYFLMCYRDGISSLAISKRVGVSQKSTWLNSHKIRNAMTIKNKPMLQKTAVIDKGHVRGHGRIVWEMVQVNEISATKITKHGKRKTIRERGRKRLIPLSGHPSECLSRAIKYSNIVPGSTIITDSGTHHLHNLPKFSQIRENHDEMDKDDFYQTSPVEALFAKMRYAYSTYRFWKPKNDIRYVREIVFRLNEGNCDRNMMDRIKSLIENGMSVPPITMKQLFNARLIFSSDYKI